MEPRAVRRELALRALGAVLAFVAANVLALGLLRALGVVAAGDDDVLSLAAGTGLGSLLFLGFAASRPPAAPWGDPLRLLPRAAWRYALFFVVWAPVMFAFYLPLLESAGVKLEPQPFVIYLDGAEKSAGGVAAIIVLACVLAPLVEELIFRGYLQHALEEFCGRWLAISIAAVLFGVLHGEAYALPIGVLGLLFGWLKVRFRSLWAPVLAHALHNGVTVALVLLLPDAVDRFFSS